MIKTIKTNKTPSFSLLNYNSKDWIVKNLIIIPKIFISESIIEKRKPLSDYARRAGWIGCNILLKRIPEEGKINVIKNEKIIPMEIVSKKVNKMSFLSKRNYKIRGWSSDILKCIEDLSKKDFTLQEVYKFEDYLRELHPTNKFIKEKIRQQIQILRDNNLIKFNGNGVYSMIN